MNYGVGPSMWIVTGLLSGYCRHKEDLYSKPITRAHNLNLCNVNKTHKEISGYLKTINQPKGWVK